LILKFGMSLSLNREIRQERGDFQYSRNIITYTPESDLQKEK